MNPKNILGQLYSHKEQIIVLGIIGVFLFRLKGIFLVRFSPSSLEMQYTSFLQNGTFISDDQIYALAGWRYIHGANPSTINFEHPPLAKYFIGVSEMLFGNPLILSLIFSSLSLIFLYFIARNIIKYFPFTLIPVLMLSMDKLYMEFSSTSLLDIYLVFFSLLSIYFLVRSRDQLIFRPLIYLSAGLAIACKWSGIFLFIAFLIYFTATKDKNEFKFLPAGILISLLTYISTYTVFFLSANTLVDFFKLQIDMYNFQHFMRFERGTPPPLWIFMNFLIGVEGPALHRIVEIIPDQGILKYGEPTYGLSLIKSYNPLTWPLSFSSSIVMIWYTYRYRDLKSIIIPISFFSVFATISLGQVFPWYILPALPLGFLSLTYFIHRTYNNTINKLPAKIFLSLYIISLIIFSFIKLPTFIPLK